MNVTQIKQPQLIKVALLLSVLVSIPKTIFLYNMVNDGNIVFTKVFVTDFLYRFVFFYIFSWLILQLNANWGYVPFKIKPVLRIALLILANIVTAVVLVSLLKFLYPFVTGTEMDDRDAGFLSFTYSIMLIVLFFIARILRLQVDRQASLIENEHLKQQNLQNELSALKNQIDPHFLFNSLNSLTALVRDNEPATKFVKKLSYMYRYILQSRDYDLVSVKEELKFLESYTYLIATRYRDRFAIDVDIKPAHLEEKIPPLAFQVLVENAVKHNEISQNHPLNVKIFSEGESIYVQNKLKPRSTLAEGTKNGLINLEKRYALLRKQQIKVNSDNGVFSVQLPLKDRL